MSVRAVRPEGDAHLPRLLVEPREPERVTARLGRHGRRRDRSVLLDGTHRSVRAHRRLRERGCAAHCSRFCDPIYESTELYCTCTRILFGERRQPDPHKARGRAA